MTNTVIEFAKYFQSVLPKPTCTIAHKCHTYTNSDRSFCSRTFANVRLVQLIDLVIFLKIKKKLAFHNGGARAVYEDSTDEKPPSKTNQCDLQGKKNAIFVQRTYKLFTLQIYGHTQSPKAR